jgi:hypothetical protein
MDEDKIIIKQGLLIPSLVALCIFAISLTTINFLGGEIPIVLACASTTSGIYFVIVLLTRSIIIIDQNGLSITNKLGNKSILWKNVISMSTVCLNDTMRYQILTTQGVTTLPFIWDYQKIEKLAIKYGNLVEESNAYPLLTKRWKRQGEEYVHISFLDRLSDPFFNTQGKKTKLFRFISVGTFIIIFIILAFIFIKQQYG